MFDITFDPKEEAIRAGLRLDPLRHKVLPDGAWLSYIKRQTGRTTLLVYEHLVHKCFVLADMIYPPDVVMELDTMQEHPDRTEHPLSLDYIRARLEPAAEVAARLEDRLKDHRAARALQRAESEDERDSVVKWLKHQGRDELAASLMVRPWVGTREGGDSLAMMRDALQSMVKVLD